MRLIILDSDGEVGGGVVCPWIERSYQSGVCAEVLNKKRLFTTDDIEDKEKES
jgi:hypothetical protein